MLNAKPSDLPHGMRINNPGNLRAAYAMSYPTSLDKGFAVFRTMPDGVKAMAALVYDYYAVHRLCTLKDFVSRYAPASENDVLTYIKNMGIMLNISESVAGSVDLHLTRSWEAARFIRALTIVEQGHPPAWWATPGEWLSMTIVTNAMQDTNRWAYV